jgi:hypothetical protein
MNIMLNRISLVGSNPMRVGQFMVWEVHVDGNMISSFFGPGSYMAAMSFVDFLKNGGSMSKANDIMSEMTRDTDGSFIYASNVLGR